MNCYLPDPGIKPTSLPSPALVGKLFTDCATWKQYTFQEPLPSASTVHDRSRRKNTGRSTRKCISQPRNCYSGYSSYYWDKSVPPMMMGITEKLLQIHGMRCLHDKCVHLMLLLQVCLLQHEGLHLKGCILFQLKQRY